MPDAEQPDTVQVVMPRELFKRMEQWLAWDYPALMLYRMPDTAQEEGMESFGVAPNSNYVQGESAHERFQRLHPNQSDGESA